MKLNSRIASPLASAICMVCMVALGTASADILYWDGNVSSANSTSDNSSTTTMAWLSGGNWDNGTTSAARSFWTNVDTAIFGGTFSGTQTVTLSSQINLGGPTTIGGVGSSYLISLNGNVYNQLQSNPNIAPAITINAGSTLSADSASNNSNNLGTLTLNGGTLTSINGPTGPANDGGFGNWTIRNVITGGTSLSTISSSTLYIAPGSFSFNVADAVAGSGTDLLVSSKIISGSLTKTGAGTMQLTGLNSYTGTTTVSQGTLLLTQNLSGFNTSAINGAVIVESGATLTMNNNPTGWGGGLTTLNVNGGTVNGNGGLGAFGVIYNLTGGNITGTARLDLGQRGATLASINSLASGTTSVINNTQGIMFRGDSGQGSYTITTAAGTTPSGVDLQINGVISQNAGPCSLVKAGSGTLLLNGNNTYTGATNVNAGTLRINGNQTSATGALTVASGATLGGSGTIGGAVTVNSGGFHASGNSIGTQTLLAGYTQNGTEQVELGTPGATASAGVSDRTVVTGNLSLGGGSTLQLVNNNGANSQGSMGAGAYRLITFSGTRTGAFSSITNPLNATLHEKVVYNGTSNGSVDLEVYRLATANTISTPVSLGNTRVGGTLSQNLSIQNTAASDGFSEGLNASGGSLTGNATTSGSITNLAGGSTSTAVSVGLNTSTAGAKTGTVTIGLASNGSNSGYANTSLTGQTVTVNGAVYNAAVANTIASVNVGKTRVGGTFTGTQTLSISNTAASGIYTEGLNATVGSTTGGASGSGSVSNLAGGSSSTSITAGLGGANTSTSGIKTGSVSINLASSGTNSGLSDLGLGSQTVGVSGTVYDYADAAFSKTGGDGSLSGGGPSYTLDFGTGLLLNTTYTATIQLANNLLSGFQDDLGGSYASIVSSEFNSGVEGTTIASVVAGSNNTFTITFFTGSTGTFTDTLTFSGLSKQSGLSDAVLGNFNIALTATAVPEPRAALLGGIGLLLLLRRRRP